MGLKSEVEDVFLSWQEGISPDRVQDLVIYEEFDESLMCVFVWRDPMFSKVLISTLENILKHKVHPDLLVSTLCETFKAPFFG